LNEFGIFKIKKAKDTSKRRWIIMRRSKKEFLFGFLVALAVVGSISFTMLLLFLILL